MVVIGMCLVSRRKPRPTSTANGIKLKLVEDIYTVFV